jgi:CRP/FNR family transcriptional regulator, nitrogen oxide reductase regulator
MRTGTPNGMSQPAREGWMSHRTPLHRKAIEPERCSIDGRLAILSEVGFFTDLDREALREVNALCRERGLAAGEVVYLAGAPAAHLFVVAAGQVKLVRFGPDGQEVVVDLLGPGDAFGSLAALGEAMYPDSAVAHSQACVLTIEASSFADLLARHPAVAQRSVAWLAQRLDDARAAVYRMGTHTAEARIAGVLLLLADRMGEAHHGATLIQLPMTRRDLAALAGTTPETASRVLAAFRRMGLVSSGRRWVAVVKPDALTALVEEGQCAAVRVGGEISGR